MTTGRMSILLGLYFGNLWRGRNLSRDGRAWRSLSNLSSKSMCATSPIIHECKFSLHQNTRDYRHEIPADTPELIRELINRCWRQNPADRPDMGVVVDDLEEILLSLAILDPEGKAFWRNNFFKRVSIPLTHLCLFHITCSFLQNQENISWREFAEVFYGQVVNAVVPQEKKPAIGPWVFCLPNFLLRSLFSTLLSPHIADMCPPY